MLWMQQLQKGTTRLPWLELGQNILWNRRAKNMLGEPQYQPDHCLNTPSPCVAHDLIPVELRVLRQNMQIQQSANAKMSQAMVDRKMNGGIEQHIFKRQNRNWKAGNFDLLPPRPYRRKINLCRQTHPFTPRQRPMQLNGKKMLSGRREFQFTPEYACESRRRCRGRNNTVSTSVEAFNKQIPCLKRYQKINIGHFTGSWFGIKRVRQCNAF